MPVFEPLTDHFSLVGINLETSFGDLISRYRQNGKPVGTSAEGEGWRSESGAVLPVIGMAVYPDQEIGVTTLHIVNRPKGTLEFAGCYPTVEKGLIYRTTIEGVVEDEETGLEACLSVGIDHAWPKITFFDTRYFMNASKYEIGQACAFKMVGLAYSLEVVEANPILFPGMKGKITDVTVQGLVKEISKAEWEGKIFHRVRIKIDNTDSDDIDLIVYAVEHAVNGLAPKAGDCVRTNIWIQGHLAE